jgi:hypothetical protein
MDVNVFIFIKEIDTNHHYNRLSSVFWNSAMNNPAKEFQELNKFGKYEKENPLKMQEYEVYDFRSQCYAMLGYQTCFYGTDINYHFAL